MIMTAEKKLCTIKCVKNSLPGTTTGLNAKCIELAVGEPEIGLNLICVKYYCSEIVRR